MYRKILTLTSALTAGVVTSASADPFNGVYVGVRAGWSQFGADFKISGPVSGNSKGSDDAFAGGIQLGYAYTTQNDIYLAGELNLDWRSKTDNVDSTTIPGADIKLGYKFDSVVPYATVGITGQKFSLFAPNNSHEDSLVGVRPGVGVLFGISENISLGTEYTYSYFEKMSVTDGNTSLSMRPHFHSIMARLVYTF